MRTLHNLHSIDIGENETGVTVRKGTKWADAVPGEVINICVCSKDNVVFPETHKVVGLGEIKEIVTTRFRNIPARLIELEHEESSRIYSGLLLSMRRAYGPEFSEKEVVVVLTYKRLTKED